ncbi:hypothetical protein CK203_090428 [Vitis vinifera]|uniref:Uncharacterized protein n=1 Tax=Vitis vinifera TaxID=29760 RepID=A0A438BVM4_VITVI|nr:hypothetical protein CK203_090428 [Vitis vinifera]
MNPGRVGSKLGKQGIRGPPPSLLSLEMFLKLGRRRCKTTQRLPTTTTNGMATGWVGTDLSHPNPSIFLRSKLVKQRIRGPPPSLLFGNVSEVKRIQLQNHSTAPRTYTTMSGFPFSFHSWTSGGKNMVCLLCLRLRLIYMLNSPNFLHMNSEF